MKQKFLLIAFLGIFLISFVSADSISLQIRYIIPDQTAPEFTNLRNFTHEINTNFIKTINAIDDIEVDCFALNDTTTFNVNCEGRITNVTALTQLEKYWLNISVNDTMGNLNWGEFYIDITTTSGGTQRVCRYYKFGYYNDKLQFFKEKDCVTKERGAYGL